MTVTSCQNDGPVSKRAKIRVRVTTDDTRGTVTTKSILEASGAFSMVSYLEDDYKDYSTTPATEYEGGKQIDCGTGGNVHLSSGQWAINGDPCWVADTYTHFWAWHPVSVTGRTINEPSMATPGADGPEYPYTGELTFSYETPTTDGSTDADKATDILFAYTKKNHDSRDSTDVVNITFHHALSQVRFCVSTNDGTFDKSLKIKSISISGLKTAGNGSFTDSGNAEKNDKAYDPTNGSYDNFVWTNQIGSTIFGQDYNADFSTSTVSGWAKGSYKSGSNTYNLYTCENVFFMIPQTVTTSNMITVVFEYKGVETTKSIPIADATGVEWLGDHYYTYKIKATTVGRDIDMSVSLVGWTNRKEEIFI